MGKDPSSSPVVYHKTRAKGSPFEQECCGRIWTKQSDFKRHSATHDPNAKHICQYEGCGKSFNQKTALKTHVNSHIGARPHKCRIESCAADFADPSSRGRHEREVHDPSFGYQCRECPFNTKRREQFKVHWQGCIGGAPGPLEYKNAQKIHEAGYMELVRKGERPPPPPRPRVYKARVDPRSPRSPDSLSKPTLVTTVATQTLNPGPVQDYPNLSRETRPRFSDNHPNSAVSPKLTFTNPFEERGLPSSRPRLALLAPSPTPSCASVFSEDERSLTTMLNTPGRSLIVHGGSVSPVLSQTSESPFAYPPPPGPNTLVMAPRPVRDPSHEIPILGQHRHVPYSPRPARWKHNGQGGMRPLSHNFPHPPLDSNLWPGFR